MIDNSSRSTTHRVPAARPAVARFALFALALAASTAKAADPGPICEASKLGASAKYALCRLKAESKAAKAGTSADYSKCNLARFASAEEKAGMGVCPTEADQTTVQDYLDDCTSTAALWLAGGGGLPDTCDSDLAACESDLAACEASPGGVPKSGQTTSYGAGSDGDLQPGMARDFTDNGDGTITDETTGLMWEKKSDDGSVHDKDNLYSWGLFIAPYTMTGTMVTTFLDRLNNRCHIDGTPCSVDADCAMPGGGPCGFAGHRDWRIPSISELQTLLNFEVPYPGPTVFPAFHSGCTGGCSVTTCGCTSSSAYWSSTTYRNNQSEAWYVDFSGGFTLPNSKPLDFNARAVRAAY